MKKYCNKLIAFTFAILFLVNFSAAYANENTARELLNLFSQSAQDKQKNKPKVDSRDIQWQEKTTKKPDQDIKIIQASLKILGFYEGAVDGVSGSATVAAVKDWQRQLGRDETGSPSKDEEEMLIVAASVKSIKEEIGQPISGSKNRSASADASKDPVSKVNLAKDLPSCDSDAALKEVKDILGSRLIDWDIKTFCENAVSEEHRQCIGRFVLNSGEERLSFTFKKMKSDPSKFLSTVKILPSDQETFKKSQYMNPNNTYSSLNMIQEIYTCDRANDRR